MKEETGGSRPRFLLRVLRKECFLPSRYFHPSWLLFLPPSPVQEETGGSLPRFLLPYVARLGGMGGLRAPDRGEQAYQVRWGVAELEQGRKISKGRETMRPTRCGGAGQRLPMPAT